MTSFYVPTDVSLFRTILPNLPILCDYRKTPLNNFLQPEKNWLIISAVQCNNKSIYRFPVPFKCSKRCSRTAALSTISQEKISQPESVVIAKIFLLNSEKFNEKREYLSRLTFAHKRIMTKRLEMECILVRVHVTPLSFWNKNAETNS